MLIPLTAAFVHAALRWYRMTRLGTPTPDSRVDQPWRRLVLALRDGIGNGFVGRETWGCKHYTFIVAFIGLFIGTSIVFINGDLRDLFALLGVPLYFYYGEFYLFFKAAMDTCFVLIIVGVLAASARRAVAKPTLLHHPPAPKLKDNWENRLGYWFPLTLLVLIPVTGLMLEGARINANPPRFTDATSRASKGRFAPARRSSDTSGSRTSSSCTRCSSASRSRSCAIS
jgi:hypothetical protein